MRPTGKDPRDMAATLKSIDSRLREWISAQHMFFVATAPSAGGHVNVSPKGLDTFRVLDDSTVAYLDLTGSGVETIAHLGDNARITVMFCAFEGNPRILRLAGIGRSVRPEDDDFARLVALFPGLPGVRSIIVVDVDRIATSCGYGVPLLRYEGERTRLTEWAESKGADGIRAYHAAKNARSIDGLAGLVAGDDRA
jgi:hypothetical protein